MPLLVVAALAAVLAASAFQGTTMPRMATVEPGNGKIGDVLTVSGENLDQAHVADVFLTDGSNDFKTQVSEQTAASLKFKIPEKIKPGRYALMILTKDKPPKLIEQPVKVTVDAPA